MRMPYHRGTLKQQAAKKTAPAQRKCTFIPKMDEEGKPCGKGTGKNRFFCSVHLSSVSDYGMFGSC